jgi:tetratricopeptide (TPR) repeat protein
MDKKLKIILLIIGGIIILGLIVFYLNQYYSIENKKNIEESLKEVPTIENYFSLSREELEKYNLHQLELYNLTAYNMNDYDRQILSAEALVSKTNVFSKAHTNARLLLASGYLNKGTLSFQEDYYADKAIEILDDLVKKDDKNPEIYSRYGYAYEIKEDYQKAIEYYTKAINLKDDESVYYVKRGHAYDLSGDLVKAREDYEKSLGIEPNSCVANMQMARIFLRNNNFPSAKDVAENVFYNCAFNVNDFAVSGEILGIIAIEEKQYEQARFYFEKVLERYKSPYSLMKLALVEILDSAEDSSNNKEEKIIKAEEYINKSLELYPNSAEAYYIYGQIFDYKEEKDLANEKYQKADLLIDSDITLGKNEKDELRKIIKLNL